MVKEIERRWLVTDYDHTTFSDSYDILQAYLDVPGQPRVRIYKRSGKAFNKLSKGDSAWAELTTKTGKGLVRNETNAEISVQAALMLKDTTPNVISKTRNSIGGWELDVFHNELDGVVLLEYELKDSDYDEHGQPVWPLLPVWVKSAVEVTETLSNIQLAKAAAIIKNDGYGTVADALRSPLHKVVITGGPCAGKSSVLSSLKNKSDYFVVPEVATILMQQVGLTATMSVGTFQRTLYNVQKTIENAAMRQAIKECKRCVVVDRGTLDSVAFLEGGEAEFEKLLGVSVESELQSYDLVIQLPILEYADYVANKGSNPVRTENYEEAYRIDHVLEGVWSKHDQYFRAELGFSLAEKESFVRSKIEKALSDHELSALLANRAGDR